MLLENYFTVSYVSPLGIFLSHCETKFYLIWLYPIKVNFAILSMDFISQSM